MISAVGKVTGKGQVQVPKEVREACGIRLGDELLFQVQTEEYIIVRIRRKSSLSELAGILHPIKPFPGIEREEDETREIVAEEIAMQKLNDE